jgi:hypothetical protein
MPMLLPVRARSGVGRLACDQADVGFMDQSGGLQRLAGLLVAQHLRRQVAQLVVDDRQELLGCLGLALLDG